MAIVLGVRAGIKDAKSGTRPFTWGGFRSSQRNEMLLSAIGHVRDLIVFAILLDLILQFSIFHEVPPTAALLVAPVLICGPYIFSRGISNPIARRTNRDIAPAPAH
jgi:hypothetical protein